MMEMEMESAETENDIDAPAIRALGSLFKLTQVFLWDDASTEVRRSSSFPRHIRFNYDDEEEEKEEVVDSDGKIMPNMSFEMFDDCTLGEDVEVTQQLSELGLPLSFQSSKEGAGTPKVKRKGKHKKNPQSQERIRDEVLGSSKVSEEEILPHAVYRDESSSSLYMPFPCHSEPSRFHCTVDFSNPAQSSSIEETPENFAAKSAHSSQQHHVSDVSYDIGDMSGVSLIHGLDDTGFVSGNSTMSSAVDLLTVDASSGSVALGGSADKHQKQVDGNVMKHADREGFLSGNHDMACEEFGSTITTEQPQASDSAEHSSKVLGCDEMDSYGCGGSLGDWGAFWDPFFMRYYFYNVQSQESTWDPPPGMENFAFCNASSSTNNSEMAGMDGVGPENTWTGTSALPSQVEAAKGVGVTLFEDNNCETTCRECNEGELAQLSKAGDLNSAVTVTYADSDKILVGQVHREADDLETEKGPPANKRKKKGRSRRKKYNSFLDTDEQMQFQEIIAEEVYVDISKYWCQRYLLFSRFDHGIQLDDEGWFSVTPETIARHQASRCGGSAHVIDCFTGVGGNAIQFAKADKHVTAVDIDPRKIDYARTNATIYGVEEHIDFIRGDAFVLAPKLRADTVFLSPPWGGPDYLKVETYNLNMLKPHDGQYLFCTFREVASRVVMFLPRNVDLNQLAELALSVDPPWSLEVEKNFLNGKLKAVTAYFSKAFL